MPPPSNLMSAAQVAETFYDRYSPIELLPEDIRRDIGRIAEHFYRQSPDQFRSVFLQMLPWNELVGEFNSGHEALGDFLVCGALGGVLSTNFDTLIEQWGNRHKIDLKGALTGRDASKTGFCGGKSPLLKIHGCMASDRERTIWATGQLSDPVISERVDSFQQWMRLNLAGKDLLVIGFWTDWDYINQVLAAVMRVEALNSVTVVDPNPSRILQRKASQLWRTLTDNQRPFEHLMGSGAEALKELREAFSRAWMRRFYSLGRGLAETSGFAFTDLVSDLESSSLYNCRRDAEGVAYNRAAVLKQPPAHLAQTACFHHKIAALAEAREESWYVIDGRLVRIVQGAGQGLAALKGKFNEPPTIVQSDIVVCVGAQEDGLPGRLISSGYGASIVRSAPGGSAKWMTESLAMVELGIEPRPIVGTGGVE